MFSRFVGEIPAECVERAAQTKGQGSAGGGARKSIEEEPEVDMLQPGDAVRHPTYGRGRVSEVTGSGPKARVQVTFPGGSVKTFILDHAPLVRL